MKNIFSKLFKRKTTEPVVNTTPSYSFIEQYTIVVPSTVLVDYFLWSASAKTPVAYENTPVTYKNDKHNYTFYDCVMLPSEAFLIYCDKFKKASNEIKKDKKMRTVSVVK